MMAYAQPTPLSTLSAPVGQFSWHAPHSMHEGAWATRTTPFSRAKTSCGQTAMHVQQPAQSVGSYSSVFVA
jgi:hypothetical protein